MGVIYNGSLDEAAPGSEHEGARAAGTRRDEAAGILTSVAFLRRAHREGSVMRPVRQSGKGAIKREGASSSAFQAAWCEEPRGMRVRSSADSVSRDVRSEARVAIRMTLAVVSVAVLVAQAQVSMGTAFAVSKDGDLVANDHVISGCGSVEARLGSRMFSGTVKVGDRSADLAVIHIERVGPEAAVRTVRHRRVHLCRSPTRQFLPAVSRPLWVTTRQSFSCQARYC
jgi:S1-C subfamily serine protease